MSSPMHVHGLSGGFSSGSSLDSGVWCLRRATEEAVWVLN